VSTLTTREDDEKLARLAMHDGWPVLARVLDEWIRREANDLASRRFNDLLEVGRSQGRMKAFEQVKQFVERRLDRIKEG